MENSINEFWNRLRKHFHVNLFGYDFIFSLSSYFSARNFHYPYFPLSNIEGIGICSHFSEANVLSLLRYVYSQDVCLFYFRDQSLEEFFRLVIDHMSPLVVNALRKSVIVAVRKYMKDISNFIFLYEDSFNQAEFRTMWIVYQDTFDRAFLDEYLSHPLFFAWYFKNKELDYEHKRMDDEKNMFMQNPQLYSQLKDKGYVGSMGFKEKEEMIQEIRQYAQEHRKTINQKKNKEVVNG